MSRRETRPVLRLGWVTFLLIIAPYFSLAFGAEFRYDTKGKRDPFLSPTQAALLKTHLGPGELHLEGIILDPGKASYVLVNGEIVREGEIFSGYRLAKIEANRATFMKDEDAFTLALREDDAPVKGAQAGKGKTDLMEKKP